MPLIGHGVARRGRFSAISLTYALIAAAFAFRVAGETPDDFYITFRYAENLASGLGFVFNPGERVFGTTAPGWALLLALGHWLTAIPVPRLATVCTAVILVVLACLLLQEARQRGRGVEAGVAGLLMLTNVFLWVHNGAEWPLALLLVVLAARTLSSRPVVAGALAGFAVWCRPDAALLVAVLLTQRWWRARRAPWSAGVACAATVGIGLLAAKSYFGTWLPGTLHAKRLQAAWRPETWHAGLDYLPEAWRRIADSYAGLWTPVLFLFGGLGLFLILRRGGSGMQALAAGAPVLTLGHVILGIPFYTWYAVPLLVALTYGLCFLGGAVARRAARSATPRRPAWLAGLAAGAVLLPIAGLVSHTTVRAVDGYRAFEGLPRIALYRQAGAWLQDHAEPGDSVAFVEIGAIGYFSRLSVYDLLGLVSPQALPFVARGDLAAAFHAAPTRFVLDRPQLHSLMAPVVERPAFVTAYQEATQLHAGGLSLTIYQRR